MRTKLPMAPKAHKPADSGVVVGAAARCCSLPEDVLGNVPQLLQKEYKTCRSRLAGDSGGSVDINVE